jgi:hypothetical protein
MPEKIRNLVSVNTQATLTRGVQLSWYGDPRQANENERLASGYIFSHGAATGNLRSAIDIFTRVRETLNTSGTHNVFTIVAQYGHGKSHFALVLANYFGRTPGDPVLDRIINQIGACTNANTEYLFRAFKTEAQKPQLVVRLSGHDFTDLRRGFMQALRRALSENKRCQNYQIGAVSLSAAKWLHTLTGEKQQQAEDILGEVYQTDLDTLIGALEAFDSTKESIARDLSARFNNGFPVDFGADLNLQEVINKVISDLCVGADAPFHKMVVLFDELGVYAGKWCQDHMAAGDLAPQQILEACDSNKGRMCMVAFIQREVPEMVKGYDHVRDDFRRWIERFPPETTFRLESSLEQVIQGLLTKNHPAWGDFARDHMPRIDKAVTAAWQILPSYQNKPEQWTQSKFTNIVGVGAFPLHPVTTGLLCNLEFTQGARTIIEVVTTAVQNKDDESAVLPNGELNFVLPTFLVDEFGIYFEGQESRYSLYKNAYEKLGSNAPATFYQVLKALFLFQAGGLKRYGNQPHAQILAQLCSLRDDEVAAALKQLDEAHGVIRFSQASREYEFTGLGTSRNEIRQMLIRQTAGQRVPSLAAKLANLNLLEGVQRTEDTEANGFKAEHGIGGGGREWHLAPRLVDAAKLSDDAIKRAYTEVRGTGEARGVVIYLISSDSDELENAQERAEETLNKLREGDYYFPVVIAIPASPIIIEQELLIHDALKGWGQALRDYHGEAYNDAIKDSKRRLDEAVTAHFRHEMMNYYVARAVREKFRGNEANHLEQIANRLFAQAFPERVPSDSNLMNLSSNPGNSKVAVLACHLLNNNVSSLFDTPAKNLATAVLHEGQGKWGVLTPTNRLQEPQDERVARSWQMLDGAVLEDSPVEFSQLNKRLQGMPYGHDDYTLTLLYAAWIGFNKNELLYFGSLGGQNNTLQQLSLAEFQGKITRAKDFIKWLNESRVQIQRPHRNARRRASEYLKQIENVTEYEKAAKLVNKFDEVIATLSADSEVRTRILDQARKLGTEIKKVHEHTKTLEDLRGRIEKTHVVRELLIINDNFPKPPETFLIYDANPHIETKRFLNARIEAEVAKQTQQPLKRREEYEAVKNHLKEMKDALRQSGRQDLEHLCVAALERIDAEYEALKSKEKEAAIVSEVESFKANEAGLAASRKQAAHIEELLKTKLAAASENTRARIERSFQQANKRVSALEEWVAALPQVIEAATELSKVRELRDEINKRERDYADTPELDTLNVQRELIEKKERLLFDQAAQQAVRQANVAAYIRAVEDQARRAEKAQTFEGAIQDLGDARSASVPEDITLNDKEQVNVDAAINRIVARVESLFRELVHEHDFSKEQEFLSHQAALERAISAVEHFDSAPAEWQSGLAGALHNLTQAFDAWRTIRSQDIANRIIDDFGKLTTPQQRADCLLRLAELCKAEGLSAEYAERLINVLKLQEASNA